MVRVGGWPRSTALLPSAAAAAITLRDGQEGTPLATVTTAKCTVRNDGFHAFARSTDRAYSISVYIEGAWRGKGHDYPLLYGHDDPELVVHGPKGPFSNDYPVPPAPVLPLGNGVAGHIGFAARGTKLGLAASLPNSVYTEGIVFFPGTLRCR